MKFESKNYFYLFVPKSNILCPINFNSIVTLVTAIFPINNICINFQLLQLLLLFKHYCKFPILTKFFYSKSLNGSFPKQYISSSWNGIKSLLNLTVIYLYFLCYLW